MNKRFLKSYTGNKYNYQYGDYITNSYSLLRIKTELESDNKLSGKLSKFYDNFYYNFESCYQLLIKDIDLKQDYIKINFDLLSIDNKFKKDTNYTISIKELKKINNLVKIDKIIIKKQFSFNSYNIVIELIKNNEVIGYLLPCRVY